MWVRQDISRTSADSPRYASGGAFLFALLENISYILSACGVVDSLLHQEGRETQGF